MELIISLLSGAIGGNIAGALLKKYSMGTLWNSVVGILGGGLGAQLLGMLNIDISGIIGNIVGSGVGGGVLMVIIGLIKGAMKK
ncbi:MULTISPECIES: hypothetical protein [unclassified Tenacibaculum]|uniref:hypothetical protein n=1 Tax=unclassified Tenacibaculum TaxID=2635139 RepID=UPI001F40FBD5|nr:MULTISPECIES: hypothetical protein [unclassified Tenacibaculum]MCF2874939.1 hypothetical protein [Tenacibaculum sp. Cn5-1]MCF2933995.1 hypothetical protein [Tenacibaculum sp. Cn5-34]MCG7510205.1 hypothetical protein [Tenacibaculum sp. Cn5-46]